MIPKKLQEFYFFIDCMAGSIGVAKQARMTAFVNQAWRKGKIEQITQGKLIELSQLPVKKIHLEKENL